MSDSADVRISLRWDEAGSVVLDQDGKLAFGRVEAAPGLYRILLRGNLTQAMNGVYVGETDNLRRRLAGNYRNPGPSQQTSRRINALLLRHLAEEGMVELAISLAATIWIAGTATALDLTSKAGRLLAESAALVQLRVEGRVEIHNLG